MNRLLAGIAVLAVASLPAFANASGGPAPSAAAPSGPATPGPATFPPFTTPTPKPTPQPKTTAAPTTPAAAATAASTAVPDASAPSASAATTFPPATFPPLPAATASSASHGTFSVETTAPAAPATSPPSGAVTPLPAPISTSLVEDPAISQRAREWLLRLQADQIDRSQIDARFNGLVTNAQFKAFSQQITSFGTLVSFTFISSARYPEGVVYEYAAQFATTPGIWFFAIDNENKIGGMQIQPRQP